MKGCVVERARPSNCIDIWPLFKEAVKEGVFVGPQPSEKALKEFYYVLLTRLMPSESHFFYLAKRGRGFLGCLHATLIPGRWDGSISTFYVDFIYVREHRRKMGVGKKLLDSLLNEASNLGIRNFEFVCPVSQVEYWEKQRNAKQIGAVMRIENAI